MCPQVGGNERTKYVCTLYKLKGQCLIQICTYVCNNTFRGLHNCANIDQLLRNYHNNESADSALHNIIHHYCVIPATTAH